VVHLSWAPRAFLFKKFLSDAECEHIASLARPKLQASDVVNSKTGEYEASGSRTSSGAFLEPGHDEVVARVEERVARATMTPRENQENMQVLRYVRGQAYEPHFDYFHDALNRAPEVGGQVRGGGGVIVFLAWQSRHTSKINTKTPQPNPNYKT
jgi:prolyl 4-hydroxylase